MLLSDVITRVTREFGDTANTQIDSADIARWSSDAQVDIARQTKCNLRTTSFLSQAGVSDYLISRSLSINAVRWVGQGLRAVTLAEANQRWPNRSAPPVVLGTPSYFWVTDSVSGATLSFYLTPDTDGQSVEVQHNTRPNPVVNAGDAFEIPEQYHRLIVDMCLKRAYGLDGQLNAVDRLNVSLKADLVEAGAESADKREDSYPSVRCLPGDEGSWLV